MDNDRLDGFSFGDCLHCSIGFGFYRPMGCSGIYNGVNASIDDALEYGTAIIGVDASDHFIISISLLLRYSIIIIIIFISAPS